MKSQSTTEKKARTPDVQAGRSGWHILGDYIRKNSVAYIVAVLAIAASSTLAALIPKLIGRFADTFTAGKLTESIAGHLALLILIAGTFRVLLGWVGRVLTAQHGRIITFRVREDLFKKWETLTPSYYHGHSTGELLSHALSDVDVIRQVAAMGINTAINGVFMLGASIYIMLTTMNIPLTISGLAPLLVIPALIRYFGPKIKGQSAKYQASLGVMSQTVEEIVGGIRTVKAFSNENVILPRFETKVNSLVAEKIRFVKLSAIFSALVPLMSSLGFIVVVWYGSYLAINHTITIGDFVAFLLYLTLLRQPLEQLGNMLNTVQRASASLGRISKLLEVIPETVDTETSADSAPSNGALEVKNLTFRYPGTDTDVLKNISFTVGKGKTLGIIGSIGSGKTSLAHLLLRLYEPPRESIFVDGIDTRAYSLEQLRKSIAYVPQNSFLFSTSVCANIAFSDDSEPDQKRVEYSAEVASVDADIQRFTDGYASEIGERGVRLSGGQKQRVAIARMIYKKSLIRILDDSLSAVDTKTERKILKNLNELNAKSSDDVGATVIISHRLSAVMNADEIIVLDSGSIIERGNHDELVKIDGTYARLWNLQSGDLGISDTESENESEKLELLNILIAEDEEALAGDETEKVR